MREVNVEILFNDESTLLGLVSPQELMWYRWRISGELNVKVGTSIYIFKSQRKEIKKIKEINL